MNNGKSKASTLTAPAGAPPAPAKAGGTVPQARPVSAPPPRPAPLFRRIDWITFLVTFAAVWIGYYLTMAPELTLEDSGELATGSFYAGIPHPPGYPVWTIYTWLWTVLVPVNNIAWRVALGEATSGALAAGLLALLVSRGSSLLIEGIEELQAMTGRWESAICIVSGFVAGMLIGYNGFMWSQSVIVEVYSFGVLSLVLVLLCLLRWIYAPHQRRYLYAALFFHGICFTNHQTLLLAAMGIEVAIAAANFRMGRSLFLGNSIIYLCGLLLMQQHVLTGLEGNQTLRNYFHMVGVSSIIAYFCFTILTRERFIELCLDACLLGFFLSITALLLAKPPDPAPGRAFLLIVAGLATLIGVLYFGWQTRKLGLEWLVVMGCGVCWLVGASFYFYMPLAGMSNPPMEWGYPRTVEGFLHALSRGQYEKANPTNVMGDPKRFIMQLGLVGMGIIEEFNWVNTFLALVPFLFFRKLHRRERAWLIGITAIYLFLAVLLVIMLNPAPDRQSLNLVRVFFTASHTLIALLVGYGLTLIAAYMATHYQLFRSWGWVGGLIAIALALLSFTQVTQQALFGEGSSPTLSEILSMVGKTFTNKDQYGLPVYAGLILVSLTVIFVAALLVYRNRAPLAITLSLFALIPLHSIMTHWSDNEQRGHWFGYWFGHEMFTPTIKGADGKPLYPEMTKDAVLFGGTDPGRFCPTYMIFCESFTPHKCQPLEDQKFDRRDVYIITQNALADGTYLNYIRAQFNRSAENDPPFFRELFRMLARDPEYETNFLARSFAPVDRFFTGLGDDIEKRRRVFTSWFTEKDFTDLSAFTARLRPSPQQDVLSKYLYDSFSERTKQLLAAKGDEKGLRKALAEDLNKLLERELQNKKRISEKKEEKGDLDEDLAAGSTSARKKSRQQELEKEIAALSQAGPLYDPVRFKNVPISEYLQDFIKENPQSHTRIRLNRLLLEAAYPKELARSIGGVYPDREIYTPSPEDSQRCFQEYLQDAQVRLQRGQLKPGEDVKVVDNRVQVSGQVAVMSINGLLTKVIFDHNPKNEFFVEESFPLDWMYRYLTPFGIIMKINRQPLPELTEEIVKKDHEFWTQYSKRLTGNVVDYDTPVKRIAEWVEKTYLHRDFSGFTGNRAFVRDDQGQKAFSKLRSSIGGIYAWRINDPENRNPVTQQRMIKEADFAFRQAFAFCPYSPEAVFRYVNLLLSLQRFEDALTIASTCQKLDPYNAQVVDLVQRLQGWKKAQDQQSSQNQGLQQLEKEFQARPNDFQAAFNLASAYMQMQNTSKAVQVLDRVLNHPQAEAKALSALIQAYASFGYTNGIQTAVLKLDPLVSANSSNLDATLALAEGYRHLHQNEKANQILEKVLNNPQANANQVLQMAREFAALVNYPQLELTLGKLVKLLPESPEAWYDLSALKASVGKAPESLEALRKAFDLSAKRRKQDPNARDLLTDAQNDNRFALIRQMPEFQQIARPR